MQGAAAKPLGAYLTKPLESVPCNAHCVLAPCSDWMTRVTVLLTSPIRTNISYGSSFLPVMCCHCMCPQPYVLPLPAPSTVCACSRFHWDLPQVLQDKYQGFLDPRIQEDFLYYADAVFHQLGDLVDQWMTFNEVVSICELGYQMDIFAPAVSTADIAGILLEGGVCVLAYMHSKHVHSALEEQAIKQKCRRA